MRYQPGQQTVMMVDKPQKSTIPGMTDTEYKIGLLVMQGCDDSIIANYLQSTRLTVQKHLNNIYRNFNFDRPDLALLMWRELDDIDRKKREMAFIKSFKVRK